VAHIQKAVYAPPGVPGLLDGAEGCGPRYPASDSAARREKTPLLQSGLVMIFQAGRAGCIVTTEETLGPDLAGFRPVSPSLTRRSHASPGKMSALTTITAWRGMQT
jgi:hypothetical protein